MDEEAKQRRIKVAGRSFPLPGPAWVRLLLGVFLVLGGFLGFLPVLGFWMVPLGLMILSVDYAPVRRFRRTMETRVLRWWRVRQGKE